MYLHAMQGIGFLFPGDFVSGQCIESMGDKLASMASVMTRYSNFFCDLATLNYKSMQYTNQDLALACLLCSRRVKKVKPEWRPEFTQLYGLKEAEIMIIVEHIWTLYTQFQRKDEEKTKSRQEE